MFYRTGYSGYYRDPRIRPNPEPYSQEWSQMGFGYPETVVGNPYLLVSGKRRSRAHAVRSLPPGGAHMNPLYVRTSQQTPIPRIPSGYEFYPSEYYSQYSSAFVSPHLYPQPEVHGNFYHPNLQHSQG
jgi:hypothetical protein